VGGEVSSYSQLDSHTDVINPALQHSLMRILMSLFSQSHGGYHPCANIH